MRSVPPRVLITVVTVVAMALLISAVAFMRTAVELDGGRQVYALLLCALVVLARAFPLQLTPRTKTTVATAPLFAAILLLSVPLAIAVAAVGAFLGDVVRRSPWFQALFNTAEAALRLAAGATIFMLIAGTHSIAHLALRGWVVAVPAAAGAMYLVNSALVELIIAVQLRHFSPAAFLRRRQSDVLAEGSLFLLGLLLAILGALTPWTLALVVGLFILLRWLRRLPLVQPAPAHVTHEPQP